MMKKNGSATKVVMWIVVLAAVLCAAYVLMPKSDQPVDAVVEETVMEEVPAPDALPGAPETMNGEEPAPAAEEPAAAPEDNTITAPAEDAPSAEAPAPAEPAAAAPAEETKPADPAMATDQPEEGKAQ